MEDWAVLALALAGGFLLGALTIAGLALARRRPRREAEREVVPFEPLPDDEPEAEPHADAFGVAAAPRASAPRHGPAGARPPLQRPPPDDSTIPTEWAARLTPQSPLPPGHTRGVCSGCGTALSVGPSRPLRIACPECGRTRLLA